MQRLLIFALFVCLASFAQASVITMADPTIFHENGTFYLTGTNRTGSGFDMYRSTDLVHWKLCGNATNGLALWKDDTFGNVNFWAPQIFKHNEMYYIAYASEEQIGIAVSDSPMGPYKQNNIHCIKNTTKQIDPFLFRDDDGTVYMYYVRLDGSNSLYVAKMKDDLSDIAEDPTFCLRPSDNTWEHTKNYTSYKVSEGPTVIKDGDYYYLLYSCNDFHDIDYSVGYAYSKSPKGPWTKVSKPFLTRHNTGMNGSGHGDLFQDDGGQWYYVFHTHASNTKVDNRRTAIVPITLTNNVKNKFIPDPSRIILCDNAAPSTATFPAANTEFEADGIHYRPISNSNAMVTFGDPVNFGDYTGELTIPSTIKNGTKSYRVTTIGSGAFHNCTRLTTVNLPTTITQISDYAFEGSSVRDIVLPSSCTKIGMRAFALCDKLRDVVVKASSPCSLTDDAFHTMTYEKGKLWTPTNRGTIYGKAAGWMNFKHISYVDESNATYDARVDNCFYNLLDNERCALTEESSFHFSYREPKMEVKDTVIIDTKPYAVTKIAKNAVRDSHYVESVVMSSPIDSIDTYGFYNCYRLKKVELPATLTYIGGYAFGSCSVLDSVVCHAQRPPYIASKFAFPTVAYNGVLLVPEGSKALYETDATWRNFLQIVEFGSSEITPTRITTPNRQPQGVYTLEGKRVPENATLHPGIYVVEGKLKVK